MLPLTGEDPKPQVIVQSAFADVEPMILLTGAGLRTRRWKPDATRSTSSRFRPTGDKWKVSNAGGRQPMWRADGRELYFVADDRRFYAVDVTPDAATFENGVPRFLFEMRANVFNVRNSYVPSPDGQRFLVNERLENAGEPLHVVLNWKPR